MGKKHDGHSSHKGHSHHKHDGFGDHHHHHGKHGFVFGRRGDDVLNGTDKNDVIFGLNGNDKIIGKDGHDWLFGGNGKDLLDGGNGNDKLFGGKGSDELLGGNGNDKLVGDNGNDVLDGGAGSDKVFGGKGNDVAVYSMSENLAGNGCGLGTRDFYDGGHGKDTLQLIVTEDQYELASVQKDIADFEQFLLGNGCGKSGQAFQFQSFDLKVRNFEKLDVVIIRNAEPVASADTWELDEDEVLVVPAGAGVLLNDSDPDNQPQPLTAVLVSGPATDPGFVLNADGSFTYTPPADFNGTDQFVYRASDGQDLSGETIVTLVVHEVNDAPVAHPDNATVVEDSDNNTIIVLDNDSRGPANESGQSLKVVDASATHGNVSINDDGTLSYTPHPDYFGEDLIEYMIEDDGTTAGVADPLQATGQVSVSVTEVNDAPDAVDDFLQVTRNSDGSPIPIKLSDLLANDSPGPANEAGQTIEVLIERLPPKTQFGDFGNLEFDDITQTLWYMPPDMFPPMANDMDRFAYFIQDNGTTNGDPDPLTDRAFVNIHVLDPVEVTPLNAEVDDIFG